MQTFKKINNTKMSTKDLSDVDLKGKRILIVEDDFISAQLIKELFSDTYVEMIHVLTGSAAVELIRNNTKIDLVLLDVQLPDVNGMHVAKQIKAKNASIPIIVQTAFAFESYINKSKEVGCEYFITKPIDTSRLFEIIKEIFKK
jgi:CheY-like chemotaxis protein